jgi:uncharacterized RDD family membrane protein YckC
MERAGFYPRAAALFLDLLLFSVEAHLAVLADMWAGDALHTHDFGTISGVGVILAVISFVLFDLFPSGSPGKRLMRLRIAAEDGSDAPRPVLARRAVAKFAPFFLIIPTVYLYAATDEWGLGNSLPSYTRAGLSVVAVVDTVISGGAVLLVVVTCFRALRADARAGHDLAAGTAVYWKTAEVRRGFTPVLPIGPGTSEVGTSSGTTAGTASVEATSGSTLNS